MTVTEEIIKSTQSMIIQFREKNGSDPSRTKRAVYYHTMMRPHLSKCRNLKWIQQNRQNIFTQDIFEFIAGELLFIRRMVIFDIHIPSRGPNNGEMAYDTLRQFTNIILL